MFLEFYSRRKNLISPVEELTYAVERMSKGDYNFRSKVISENELGLLAKNFNDMAEKMINCPTTASIFNRFLVYKHVCCGNKQCM